MRMILKNVSRGEMMDYGYNNDTEEDDVNAVMYRLHMPSEFQTTYQCIQCRRDYNEPHNVGKLNCRFHPGIVLEINEIVPVSTKRVYSCCGRRMLVNFNEATNGCLRCDHMNESNMIPCVKVDIADRKQVRYQLQKRFECIRSFAVMTIPLYMIITKAIRKPHIDNIIYDSSYRPITAATTQYTLKGLKEARSSSNDAISEKNTKDEIITLFNHNAKSDVEDVILDLNEIKQRLYKQSQCSPLYQLYTNNKSTKRQKKGIDMQQVDKHSNATWKSDPTRKDDFLNEEDEYDKMHSMLKMDYLMVVTNSSSDSLKMTNLSGKPTLKTTTATTTQPSKRKLKEYNDNDAVEFCLVKRIDNKRMEY
jgi:hypothetical protein